MYLFPVSIPKGENVINISFPFPWLGFALLDYFRFNFHYGNIGKGHCHFRTHSGSLCLRKFTSLY